MAAPTTLEVERKFVFQEEAEDRIKALGGVQLKQKTFKDTYYDTNTYDFTMADHWLRLRDDKWELKCPPHTRASEKRTTQYVEYDKEEDILKAMNSVVQHSCDSVEALVESVCPEVIAEFTTCRTVYQLDGLTIDLDSTDFGFRVGELELVVDKEELVPDALSRIDALAQKIGVQSSIRVPGKMDTYLKNHNPQLYERLLQKHITC